VIRALGAALAIAVTTASHAAEITLFVGFPPGQGADVESGPDATTEAGRRLTTEPSYEDAGHFYAEHLGRFLPDAQKIVMKSAPGASSLLAARRLLADTSSTAATLALLGPRVTLEPLVTPANAPWRPDGVAWIGAMRRDDDLCVARTDAPAREIGDLRTKEMFAAALAPGSRAFVYARALNELAGAKLKIISGYGSEFEILRAMETDEVNMWCGWSMTALRNRHPDLLRDGKVRALGQFTMTPAGQGLSIPRASDFPETDVAREAMRVVESQTRFGAFALAAPPSTSPARVAELRAAFLAMSRDAETVQAAAARGLDIDPVSGEELQQLATSLNAVSPAARDRLRTVLRER
jgi:tripartite-type tricarboxylate transporter receptor subunit TctC